MGMTHHLHGISISVVIFLSKRPLKHTQYTLQWLRPIPSLSKLDADSFGSHQAASLIIHWDIISQSTMRSLEPKQVTLQVMAVQKADIVAMDFYSRYQRSTGPPCTRFSQADHLPPCKVNKYDAQFQH